MKGPSLFVAQYVDADARLSTLDGLAAWAASLGSGAFSSRPGNPQSSTSTAPRRAMPIATRCAARWRATFDDQRAGQPAFRPPARGPSCLRPRSRRVRARGPARQPGRAYCLGGRATRAGRHSLAAARRQPSPDFQRFAAWALFSTPIRHLRESWSMRVSGNSRAAGGRFCVPSMRRATDLCFELHRPRTA